MKTEYIYSLIVIVLISVSCGQRQDNPNNQRPFPQVSVPSMMTDSREAAEFLSEHFWDEFTDTSGLYPCDSVLVNGVTRADLEQAYVNWLSVLDMVPYEEATASVQRLFDRISAVERKDTASSVFEAISEITGKYLYDPNSPFRNEDFYLPFVKSLSQSPFVPEEMKPGYEYDAPMHCYWIPASEFEQVMLPFFAIDRDTLRELAQYDPATDTYPWRPMEGDDHTFLHFYTIAPEVTACRDNGDGTLTLTVELYSTDLKTDCLFAHELTVRPLGDAGFQFVGNRMTFQTEEYGLPYCEPRLTWGEMR